MVQILIPFGQKQSGDRAPRTFSVAEAVRGADRCLGQTFGQIWVRGEVSNLRLPGSGHAYFTLKDKEAALPTAMFRSALQRVRFRLEEGQSLRVMGRLGLYPAQGRFQMYAERAEIAGLGDRMVALDQLKRKLAAEGLFAAERKRQLPRWPRIIGVVTSPDGAAVHDITKVIARRCPSRVLLSPAVVQGDDAPRSLVAALARLSGVVGVDVIIVGRGGGSVEDLWAFNDEALARAVVACPVPVVSAVGHEVDTTICDLVADLRAATPSQAAEIVVLDRRELLSFLDSLERRLLAVMQRRLVDVQGRFERSRHALERCGRRIVTGQRKRMVEAQGGLVREISGCVAKRRRRLEVARERLLAQHPRSMAHSDRVRLVAARERLARLGDALVADSRLRLGRASAKLGALSPLAVLERGYAVAQTDRGRVVRSFADVAVGDAIELRLGHGRVRATVRSRGEA
ncbi:MAG: exodeoxyribonuclease VII large subunit [Nannocystaceae bacterium]